MNAKKLSVAAALAACLGFAVASMTSSAQGPVVLEIHYIYYADAAHTVKVGEEWMRCNRTHTLTGVTSEYYVVTQRKCS
ncbi:hypothetical protein [Lysobacter enzymogenes]|uniref:Secreted protein n=1 Tax=Lysobacter enzymogenes TaxID=69 RepID=A0AAU9AJP9_LYSEN|nr:hypothetical protein [Lysobacter enzymogenes]BAV97978.1 hypothetical protein LEN_2491 [Lysobacter enzymogenes]